MALLVVSVALVAASARAERLQGVVAQTVFSTHRLPANTITTFTAACRSGYIATSAGVSKPASGTTLLNLVPVGVRSYRFRFGNPALNGAQRVTVAVACRRLASRSTVRYALRLRALTKSVVVPARRTVAASLACPAGTVPAGAGTELDPTRQPGVDAYRGVIRLSVRRQISTLDRFAFSVLNSGPQRRTVVVHGSCVTLARSSGAPRRRLHVDVETFRVSVAPGRQTVSRRCPRGWFSHAAGFTLQARPTQITGAAALGAGGRWTVESDATRATIADLQLACARVGP